MVKTKVDPVKKIGFFERSSSYGFELFMSLLGLVTTLIVIDYCLFALFNYIKATGSASVYMGEFTLWIVAAMAVWLPVTIVFYLRSRGEAARNPLHEQSTFYKVVTSIYYFCVIIGAIGLAFGAIYALIRMAVNPDESVGDVLLRIVLPAVLAVVIHIGMMFAYTKLHKPNRRVFVAIFSVLAAGLAITLFVISAGVIRGVKQDDTAVMDLNTIQSSIINYHFAHTTVPSKLSDIDFSKQDIEKRLSRYEYTKVDTERYELCVDFASDAPGYFGGGVSPATAPYDDTNDNYKGYADFYYHKKGHICYKLRIPTDPYLIKSMTDTSAN